MATKCPKCHFENPEDTFYCGKCATPLPSSKDISESQTETLQTPIKELTTGSTFAGRYQIIEELGKGGMGKVYKVFDTDIKEKVALKLLKSEIASDRETIERFSNELRLARKISHRNVCRMYDLGRADGMHYITMEYVQGEDLKSMIRMTGMLGIGTVLSVGKQVCDGLTEAHSLGVVHRDLKPTNIMIDKGGNAKIMDFGIARSIREKGITGPSVLIGTPEYMSPEQAEAKEVDHRSDIYSLGIILYEMATGRVPFEGETALSIAMKHKGEIPKNPKQFNANIPDDLSSVILKCLEKDRSKRYQTAADVRSELEKIEKGIPTTERVVPERRTLTSREITVKFSLKKVLWPGLIAISVIIAGLIFWQVFLSKEAPLAPEKPEFKAVGLPKWESSIAVLPFENRSPEQGQEYFCDGMTDELITKLTKSQKLRVISRNSVFAFKNAKKSTKAIAQELNVKYVLEGSVRKSGQRVVISANLVDAETEATIWADSYDRNLEDIFDVQNAVAQAIVEALQLKLTPEETRAVARRPIENADAYECYLKARQDIYSSTQEGLDRAHQEIEKALSIAEDNVLLYSTLGLIYYQYVNWGIKREENLRKTEETVAKIFLLEPDSSHGHKLLGLIQLKLGKAKEAARHLKRALVSNLEDSDSLYWLSFIYAQAGQMAAARQTVERLSQVDPVFAPPNTDYNLELMDGQFERALTAIKLFLSSYKTSPQGVSLIWEIWTLAINNSLEEAYEKTDKFIEKNSGFEPDMLLFLKYSLQGQKAKALSSATERLKEFCQTDEQWSWMLADCYALIDEKEEAIRWLEIAVNRGFVNYPFISKYDPFLKNIRGEPEFKKLMERVKYEWEHFEE